MSKMPEFTDEMKAKILEGKTEEEQMLFRADWALGDLAKFFESIGDNRFYKINAISRALEAIWQQKKEIDSVNNHIQTS
jgi:hypothetical protein